MSLGYNLARVKEACGSLKAAEAEYRELLKQFPQYGDCCLRLACIARARGDTKASGGGCCRTEKARRPCLTIQCAGNGRHPRFLHPAPPLPTGC